MQYSAITRHSGLGEGAWGKAAEAGMVKIKAVQPSALGLLRSTPSTATTREDEPMYSSAGGSCDTKNPWPTLTGRQQFYIDHPWFMEAGEQLLDTRNR